MTIHLSQKKCAKCNQIKDLDAFYKNARYLSGRTSYCKECMKVYKVEWDETHVGDRARYRRTSHLKAKYGISLEDYEALLEGQDGMCAICSEEGTRQLSVDHCHTTGRIRGLLCDNCNHALGKFRDNPVRIRRALEYLETT
jgi:hypothetical protein